MKEAQEDGDGGAGEDLGGNSCEKTVVGQWKDRRASGCEGESEEEEEAKEGTRDTLFRDTAKEQRE